MIDIKVFLLRRRPDSLKVQRMTIPFEISALGARSIRTSPDRHWLAIVGSDNSIKLHRVIKIEESKKCPEILAKAVSLKRLHRDQSKTKDQHGSLGGYDRSITHLAFSADSRILAVADLSGFLDTWVLEGRESIEEASAEDARAGTFTRSDEEDSDDDSSDDGSRDGKHAVVIHGQRWIRNPSAALLIKLPSAPLILTFRPSTTQSSATLSNGIGIHPTRHTPHPHAHDLPSGEDRLFVITAENQMYEFNILPGKLSDWSRRNPPSSLPPQFRDLRDRAMGSVWDTKGQNERIWIYGVTWLWMFDLSRDLPTFENPAQTTLVKTNGDETKQLKRKRECNSEDDAPTKHSRRDTGAGSKVRRSEFNLGIGSKVQRIKGLGVNEGQLISLDHDQSLESDEERDDVILANEDSSALVSLRRGKTENGRFKHEISANSNHEGSGGEGMQVTSSDNERLSHWHTFKYRPILGIVPLERETDDEAQTNGINGDEDESSVGVEVALVERPLWDVVIPPRYHGNQEWDP